MTTFNTKAYHALRQKAMNAIVMGMADHKALIASKMVELGYVKAEKVLKAKDVKPVVAKAILNKVDEAIKTGKMNLTVKK